MSEAKTSIARAAHRVFAELACDLALVVQTDGTIEYANDGATSLIGMGGALKGQNLFSYVCDENSSDVRRALAAATTGTQSDLDVQLFSAAGDSIHMQARIFRDIGTGSLWLVGPNLTAYREREAHLLELSTKDSLTGLPNRAGLADSLEDLIKDAKRRMTRFAVIAVDLDGFKRVNDAFGHLAGDLLLTSVAARIKSCVRDEDTVSRTGGDEFFLLLTNLKGQEELDTVCNRLVEAVRRPVSVSGQEAYVSASVGVAIFPEHGTTSAELMHHADLAMYQSKQLGKNRVTMYLPELKTDSTSQISLEADMHRALRQGEFRVYYQPIVDTSGELRGCEALMRWRRPDGSWVSPAEFIPVAERNGLITLIGDYVIRAACFQLKCFDDGGLPGLYMSVNVSPRQLRNADFEKNLVRALEISGIDPRRLVLEITENMLMSGQERTQALLRKITATGVRFSLDDFGTGYSCLAYLKTYPISALKIDKSFVDDVATDEVSRAIVKAIIDLAKALKVNTIVEGVETREQADILRELGADFIQGYFYSRPIPPNEMLQRYALSDAA